MNTSQVIDELAEKFGTTAKYLVAEMARYYIVTDIVVMVISVLIAIACFIVAKKSYKKAIEDKWGDDFMPILVCVFASVGCFIAVFVFIYDLANCVGWIVSPTAGAINYIVR